MNYAVIIPNYNSEKYLKETINSVLNQSMLPKKIIIVDDNSTDSSLIQVNQIKSSTQIQIDCIELERNYGYPAHPRNIGLDLLCDDIEYIAFLDSDDVWSSKKIELQYEFIKSSKLKACATRVVKDKASFNLNVSSYDNPKILTLNDFKYNNPTKSCSTLLVEKNAIKNLYFIDDIKFKGIEDYYFMCEFIGKHNQIGFLNEKLVYYRQHHGAISSNKVNMLKLRWHTHYKKKEIFKKYDSELYGKLISELIYITNQFKE